MSAKKKLIAAACALLLSWSCASEGDRAAENRTNVKSDGGGAGPNGPNGSLPGFVDGGGSTLAGCETHCSADLHSVVDCHDNVVKTCPTDQGCSAGGCAPACDAAKTNKSTVGCDYYDTMPDSPSTYNIPCFAVFVANTWSEPVTINAEYNGQSLDILAIARIPSGTGPNITYSPLPNGQLPPAQVAMVFLVDTGPTNCPEGITAALNTTQAAPVPSATAIYPAFHISTSRPVTAYDIFPYGGGHSALTGATLLLPTSVWDTNYIALGPGSSGDVSDSVKAMPPWVTVVAAEDNTTVKFVPRSDIAADSSGRGLGGAANQVETFTLKKGEAAHLQTISTETELAGSPIQADKPVGVFSGIPMVAIPRRVLYEDEAHQQLAPVSALGNEYAAVRYRNRYDGKEETVPWRLVGAVDGTTLVYEPSAPAGAPTTLGAGQIADFTSSEAFVVRSQDAQHPFSVNAYMTGCSFVADDPDQDCRGDSDWVHVVPTAQYLASYVFFTDPTYPETNLVLVRRRGPNGFADVKLDCAGNISGWQPLGTSGALEYTRTDLSRHVFQGQNGCDNGRHEISSAIPFAVTVWGWGSRETGDKTDPNMTQYVSYAYPAGESGKAINTVVVPAVSRPK